MPSRIRQSLLEARRGHLYFKEIHITLTFFVRFGAAPGRISALYEQQIALPAIEV